METAVVTKTKRSYKKYDWSGSVLMNLLESKQKSTKELSEKLGVGLGTAKRYFKNPLNMNGHQRKVVCAYLEITASELTNMIDG